MLDEANFDICTRKSGKSAIKHSIEKPMLLNFVNLFKIAAINHNTYVYFQVTELRLQCCFKLGLTVFLLQRCLLLYSQKFVLIPA